MAIRQLSVNSSTDSFALVSSVAPGFMSPQDKVLLDALVKANASGGNVGNITVEYSGDLSEIIERITLLENTVAAMKSKLDAYPAMHSNDNCTYAIKNSAWEIVAGANDAILVDSKS